MRAKPWWVVWALLLLPRSADAVPIGFVYDGSQFTLFTEFTNTAFYGINDAGTIVGYQQPGTPGAFGVVVQNGVLTLYDFGQGLFGSGVAFQDINANGEIVGSGIIGDGYSSFVVRDGEVAVRFHYGFRGINDAALVVGAGTDGRGKLFDGSGDVDVPHSEIPNAYMSFDFPGAVQTIGEDINNSNLIAGTFMDAQSRLHGFVGNTALAAGTFVTGLNDVGQAVGYTPDGVSFLYDYRTGAMTTFAHPHGYQTFAQGINNNGMIVGYADVTVPEPSTLLLLGTAVGPLGFRYWRRRRRRPLV